ncbi:MAG: helix-turn-helix domain-containing protein [Nocardioides sp.]|uniref:helix-turn-helix domain-containing protein n=1 Tax=Nocardioides sp. TaxID=35761 RepID=UPI003D6A6514
MRYSEVARDSESAQPLLISVEEAGQMLGGLRPWTIRALCVSGELKAGKVGNLWRIRRTSVLEYAERITTKVPAAEAS